MTMGGLLRGTFLEISIKGGKVKMQTKYFKLQDKYEDKKIQIFKIKNIAVS